MGDLQTLSNESLASEIAILEKEGFKSLEPKLRAFAFAYVDTYCHLKAAETIGMARSSGLAYLRNPYVLAMVNWLQERYADRNVIVRDWVASKLLEIFPKVSGEEEINLVDNGVAYTAKKFDGPTTARLISEASKLAGIAEKKEITSGGKPLNFRVDLSKATDSLDPDPDSNGFGEK